MKRLFSIFKWAAIGAATLALLIVAVLAVYTRTQHFQRLVQDQLVRSVNQSIPGEVSLERLEGTLWGDLVLRGLRVRYRDDEIAHLPWVRVSYSWRQLLQGRFQLSRVEAREPVLRLTRDRDGSWNLAEAFSSGSAEPSTLELALNRVLLRQAAVDVTLSGENPQVYRLSELDLAGRLTLKDGGVEAEIREITSRLRAPELPELAVSGGLAYRDTSALPILTMTGLRVASADSRFELDGRLEGLEKPRLEATITLKHLASADVARVVPAWPVKQPVTGTVIVNGTLEDLQTRIQLAAAQARLSGRLVLHLARETPSFRGKLNVAGIDPRQYSELEGFAGVVSGDIELEGSGTSFAALQAQGTLRVRSAEAAGWTLGNASVNFRLRDELLAMDAELKGELGSAALRGEVTVSGRPRYDFTASVRNLDIKKVSRQGATTGGTLNFKASIAGSGVALPDLAARGEIAIMPSRIGAVRIQGGDIKASLADGRIRIASGTLRSADTTLKLSGDLGADLSQRGSLVYDLRSQDLSPWLSLIEHKGGGSASVTGRVQGNLESFETDGTAKLIGLRVAGISLNEASLTFDLTRNAKQALPEGVVKATVHGFAGGVRLRRIEGSVNLTPQAASAMSLRVKARDETGRAHALAADLAWGENKTTALLNQLSLQMPDGIWSLEQPASITKIDDQISLERVNLRNGSKNLLVDGGVSFPGKQALNFSLQQFPLEGLAAFLPEEPKMTGLLSLEGRLGGTAAAPVITASARLRDSTIGGQRYAGASADLTYTERAARIRLEVRQDERHTLTAEGALPLALSWHDGWRSEVTGAMDVRVQSTGLSMAFLNAYSGKSVEDVAGELVVDMRIRGTLKAPDLLGSFRLRGGKLKAVPLGVQIDDVAIAGSVDSKGLRIESFVARAADGRLEGQGLLALNDYQAESFKLSLNAKRWPAINTQRYRAETNGRIAVQGKLTAPKVTGEIEIVEASVRPDLKFLEKSSTPITRDGTIVIVNGKDPQPAEREGRRPGAAGTENTLFKKTKLDLNVRVPGNFWIRHPDALVELRGRLGIEKGEDKSIDITGASEIVRGWVAFQGRRFNLTRGRIEFTKGGKIDPALDIVAEHRLSEYQVTAVVGGTAQSPSLTLSSQPQLEQADILAVLLFGKPVSALNQGEQASLRENALEVTSGFVAAKIGSAVSEALGLSGLGIDIGDLDFEGGKVGYGRYIGRDTYVSFSQELAGEKGREVSVEYQLAPNWKLGTSTDTRGASGVEIIWSKQY